MRFDVSPGVFAIEPANEIAARRGARVPLWSEDSRCHDLHSAFSIPSLTSRRYLLIPPFLTECASRPGVGAEGTPEHANTRP